MLWLPGRFCRKLHHEQLPYYRFERGVACDSSPLTGTESTSGSESAVSVEASPLLYSPRTLSSTLATPDRLEILTGKDSTSQRRFLRPVGILSIVTCRGSPYRSASDAVMPLAIPL